MPTSRTFREWIEFYEKKTGEVYEPDEKMQLLFDVENGFMEWGIDEKRNALIIGKTAGNGKLWEALALRMARTRGLSRLLTFTRRNPVAYMRRYPEVRVYGTWFERSVNDGIEGT